MDRSQTKQTLYCARLLPFGIASVLYIGGLHWNCFAISKITNAIFKCLPMLALIFYVWSIPSGIDSNKRPKWFSYNRCVVLGLILGTIGDWCLVFPDLFVAGMIAFAIGHIFYIYAYGFSPLRLKLGVLLYAACAILLLLIRDQAPNRLIRDAMPFYSVFLVTMCWRAVARINNSFPRIVCAIGGLLFVISDFFLVLQMQKEFQFGRIFVITTYYLSQLGASISAAESLVPSKKD